MQLQAEHCSMLDWGTPLDHMLRHEVALYAADIIQKPILAVQCPGSSSVSDLAVNPYG